MHKLSHSIVYMQFFLDIAAPFLNNGVIMLMMLEIITSDYKGY